MRQRAAAIDMEPDIQEKCLHDLSRYCADKHGKGQVNLLLQYVAVLVCVFSYVYVYACSSVCTCNS